MRFDFTIVKIRRYSGSLIINP